MDSSKLSLDRVIVLQLSEFVEIIELLQQHEARVEEARRDGAELRLMRFRLLDRLEPFERGTLGL